MPWRECWLCLSACKCVVRPALLSVRRAVLLAHRALQIVRRVQLIVRRALLEQRMQHSERAEILLRRRGHASWVNGSEGKVSRRRGTRDNRSRLVLFNRGNEGQDVRDISAYLWHFNGTGQADTVCFGLPSFIAPRLRISHWTQLYFRRTTWRKRGTDSRRHADMDLVGGSNRGRAPGSVRRQVHNGSGLDDSFQLSTSASIHHQPFSEAADLH